MVKQPQVIVQETTAGRYTQEITIGLHTLTGDEPSNYGGNDLGPSPYDFLLTALGTCTSMTVRMYATLKKFPLEKITVKLSHNKIHVEDCKDCENEKAFLDQIDVVIELEGNLSDEQRNKLLEIANKCPVHRTLTSKTIINTQLISSQ